MINKFLKKNKKIIKIFIIIFLFCYILKKFKVKYEYFEVCQNHCEIACDDLTDSNQCESACDLLSDQGCTFKSNDAIMDFGCYFNYQEEDITYTKNDADPNDYGMLSCNDGKNRESLINPKCSVGSLALNPDTSYTPYSDSDNPIASCPRTDADGITQSTSVNYANYSCDDTSLDYMGTEKEVWDQIYYNGNRNLLEYRKPTCAVKNTGF